MPTAIVNTAGRPALGELVGGVIVRVTVVGFTITTFETVTLFPKLSVTTAEMVYVPAVRYVCATDVVPLSAPRSLVCPSPQSTITLRIVLGLVVAAPTSNEKRAGSPAVGAVVGGLIRSVGAPARVTVTVPEAWPAAGVVGVVVVPPPLAGGGVVLEPPCAPTLAVTVAVVLVVRTVCAAPALSVVTSVAVNVPALVENDTGASTSAFPLMSSTEALIVDEPPSAGTCEGLALTVTRPTAAVPTRIFRPPAVPTLAPPDIAVIVAVPDAPPALNMTMA